jgi:dihydroxyacetone kinase DhaKLM complex PTS-EIIA-like component DhaM
MAAPRVPIEHAGGTADAVGTDGRRIRDAIRRADTGNGVAVLGNLGDATLVVARDGGVQRPHDERR